jgi:hypothetical protein
MHERWHGECDVTPDTLRDLYLVLASSTCSKVLALHTIHVTQFRVWNFDTDKIGEGVHPCMPVYAGANDLSR